MSEKMAKVDETKQQLELDSTQADAALKKPSERQYEGAKERYGIKLDTHAHFCVNCFVDGLGRSRSMCSDMGVEFVPDQALEANTEYMTRAAKDRYATSETKQLLRFYNQVIRCGGAIQGVQSCSIAHFCAIKGYLERVKGMCEDGWPMDGNKRTDGGPGSWRLLYNQTVQQTGDTGQTPQPFV